jgi:hypothetical protein
MVKMKKAGQFSSNGIALPQLFFSAILRKVLAGLERYGISTFDFDLFACLRIPTFAGFSINLLEGTKANKRYSTATCLQSSFYSIQKRLIGLASSCFCNTRIPCHLFNQFCFCQETSSFRLKGNIGIAHTTKKFCRATIIGMFQSCQ